MGLQRGSESEHRRSDHAHPVREGRRDAYLPTPPRTRRSVAQNCVETVEGRPETVDEEQRLRFHIDEHF
jgi:hypothetical protein